MQLYIPSGEKEIRAVCRFRRDIYRGDINYVSTASFTPDSLLFGKTAFVRSGSVLPICVREGEKILATAVCFSHKSFSHLAFGCFEALPNQNEAVTILLDKAKAVAYEKSLQGTVIGLSAHISYAVGIQTAGFEHKAAFDSVYNKPYYADYFKEFPVRTLSSYRGEVDKITAVCPDTVSNTIKLRFADLRHFKAEAETMRKICDATIGKTYLYYPTEHGHFYDLLKDLLPFLRSENLIFAEQNGKTVGFLFWHPDYNQMLSGGCHHSTAGIGISYLLHRKNIDTAILNAIGSVSPRVTGVMLTELKRQIAGKFKWLETTFVWDENRESTALNQRFFNEPVRRYAVYLME